MVYQHSLEHFLALQERGRTFYKFQRYSDARQVWTEALSEAKREEEEFANRVIPIQEQQKTSSNLVACLLKLGLAQDAVQEAHRCIALDATWPKAHWRLAEAHRQNGNHTATRVALETVRQLDPNYPGLQELVAQINNNINNEEKKPTIWSQAINTLKSEWKILQEHKQAQPLKTSTKHCSQYCLS